MSEPAVKFEELPQNTTSNRYAYFWAALAANPGQWAVWPGSTKISAASVARAHSKNGCTYEGAVRMGKVYFRAVAS